MPETAGSAHSGRRRRKLLLLDHRPPRHQSGLTRALDQGMFTRVGRLPLARIAGRRADIVRGAKREVRPMSRRSPDNPELATPLAADTLQARSCATRSTAARACGTPSRRMGAFDPNLALHTALSTLRAISPASVNFTRPKAIGDWLPRRVAPVFHDERRASTKRHT